MVPGDETRRSPASGQGVFEGRDLLVGRPEGAVEDKPAAEAADVPAATPTAQPEEPSPQPAAHDDAIAEILATVRATAARIDALQDEPGSGHEAAEALARETAALTQAVADARGALVMAAELASRRDGAAETARARAGAAAALQTQGEALDQRIHATDRQSAVAAHSLEDMNQSATALGDQLRSLRNDLSRISHSLRWRHWRFGLAVAGAAFVFFAVGAVMQREANIMSFGDPRYAWNDFVAEHYSPTLAACTSRARQLDEFVRCQMHVGPSPELTVPLYPDVGLTKVPPEEEFDGTTDR